MPEISRSVPIKDLRAELASILSLVYHYCYYRTREEAIKAITEYIEVFHNRQRRQARLGYLSLVAYLKRYYVERAVAWGDVSCFLYTITVG